MKIIYSVDKNITKLKIMIKINNKKEKEERRKNICLT